SVRKVVSVGNTAIMILAIRKLDPIPIRAPAEQRAADSSKIKVTMNVLEAPKDRRIPIARVRSVIVVYIERKITRTPMHNAINTTLEINASNAGKLFDIINLTYSRRGMTPYHSRSSLMYPMEAPTRTGAGHSIKKTELLPDGDRA